MVRKPPLVVIYRAVDTFSQVTKMHTLEDSYAHMLFPGVWAG